MGDIDRDEEFPISVRLVMCPAERERDPSRFRASGRPITPELPVLVVLVLPLPRLRALVPGASATSTASPFLFPGLPSEVSSSPAVVVTKSSGLYIYSCRPPHCPVELFPRSFSAAPDAYRREGKSGEYLAMKLNNTHFNS